MSDSETAREAVRADEAESEAPPGVQILKIKSRFATLALREGGKSPAVALQAADAFLRDEKDRYRSWLADALHQLDHTLDELPGSIPEALQAAYQQAAQIRDLGGTFGAPLVTEAADSLCELLYRLREAGLYNSEAIAAHLSVLRLVCTNSRVSASESAELISGLRKLVTRYPRPLPAPRKQADTPIPCGTLNG